MVPFYLMTRRRYSQILPPVEHRGRRGQAHAPCLPPSLSRNQLEKRGDETMKRNQLKKREISNERKLCIDPMENIKQVCSSLIVSSSTSCTVWCCWSLIQVCLEDDAFVVVVVCFDLVLLPIHSWHLDLHQKVFWLLKLFSLASSVDPLYSVNPINATSAIY